MDSKEATSAVSGSSYPISSDDFVENVSETNLLNSDDTNTDKKPIGNDTSVSRSSGFDDDDDDDDEGFASGEEEAFETALEENSVLAEENLGNVDEGEGDGESFLEPSEYPMLKAELSTVNDDVVENVDKVDEDEGLVGKGSGSTYVDVLKSSAVGVGVVGEEAVPEEKLSSNEVVEEQVLEVRDGDKVGEREKTVVDEKIESLISEGSVVTAKAVSGDEVNDGLAEKGAEKGEKEVVEANGVKLTTEGDSFVEAVEVDMPAPGVAVVTNVEEDEDEDADEGVVLVGGPGYSSRAVEAAALESVDKNAVKLTAEGDSIVEAVDVDAPVPGVAVVTRMQEDEDAATLTGELGFSGQVDHLAGEVVDKEVIEVIDSKFAPLDVEAATGDKIEKNEKKPEAEIEKGVDHEAEENGSTAKAVAADSVEVVSNGVTVVSGEDEVHPTDSVQDKGLEIGPADKFILEESGDKDAADEQGYVDGSGSEGDTDGMIFGNSEAAKQFIEELERGSGGGSNSGGESSQDRSHMIDGQIVTDSDEDDDEGDGKELFDSAALAALLKAAADGGSDGGNITFSSQDGSRLFTVERPAGLGSSLQTRPAPRPTRSNFFSSSSIASGGETDSNLSDEERKKLEKLQSIRVKFLRLVLRLGLSPDESVAAQVLYRLALIAGRQTDQSFSLEAAKRTATELEADGKEDLDFSINILVIGKSGVGKSATINSIFGEEKSAIDAFKPGTAEVKELTGMVDGVKVRVFDTPGLKSSVMDQPFNKNVLSSAKKLMKKNPPDIVLYVDRLDAQTRDLNDLPLLRTIVSSLGPSIWRSAIVTLTHGASAPPEGPSGSPLSYEVFVSQRSHVVQQCIGQAVGDLRMMSPSLMNPVSLVENHPSCRKNREGQKVLPNGQTWRPQLLLLCYSMKILSEANSLSKSQDAFDTRKLFGFRVRSPPLPYMLSSMLQSRAHPKLSSEQGGDGGDSDVDLADLSDLDQEEEEDEYDQLPPFKPLRRAQLAMLSKEQKDAYFDEYEYRVKLLQKKQWKEELKRMKEMKKRGKDGVDDYANTEEEGDGGAPAPVAVPLPDMVLPPSFDSDNAAYRYRFLEPTSQFLARPVLDTHGWDHDCGYDGVNIEQSLAVASRFPASVSVQITKDKKDFSINLDSSISAKHGENGSSMAGFDIQPIGKQLAYIVRGETKFKNLKRNKTAAGLSVTFLGENVVTGFKIEDQIAFGKQYSMLGSAGTVRFQNDSAYGANIEVQRRELDYPIGQVQSTFGLSIIKWRGDLALGFNSLAQFSAGRGSKVTVRAGINNKMSGQITVRTSSSEHLSLALAAVLPSVIAAYKKLWPGVGEKYSTY